MAAAIALTAFAGTSVAVSRHYSAQLSVAQDSARVAHVALAKALDAARAESAWAASLAIVGAEHDAASARLAVQVARATDTANVYRGKYLAAVSAAPDTCKQIVVSSGSLVASLDAVNSELRTELDTTRAARDAFKASADSARAAFATLSAPVARVDNAAQSLVKASHEPFFSRIAPHPQVTAGGGIDTQGRPVAAVIVGFGWRL